MLFDLILICKECGDEKILTKHSWHACFDFGGIYCYCGNMVKNPFALLPADLLFSHSQMPYAGFEFQHPVFGKEIREHYRDVELLQKDYFLKALVIGCLECGAEIDIPLMKMKHVEFDPRHLYQCPFCDNRMPLNSPPMFYDGLFRSAWDYNGMIEKLEPYFEVYPVVSF